MKPHDEQHPDELEEFDSLRDAYHRQAGSDSPEPGEMVDARIRAEARRALRAGRPRPWTSIVAVAATIAGVVLLLPNLLLEQPDPLTMPTASGQLEITTRMPAERAPAAAKSEPARISVEESAAVADAALPAASLPLDATEPDAVEAERRRSAEREAHARAETDTATLGFVAEARQQRLATVAAASEKDVDGLREALADAPEAEWRRTLVELRDSDRRALAEQLMPAYREKFDLEDDLTLDMLVAEAN